MNIQKKLIIFSFSSILIVGIFGLTFYRDFYFYNSGSQPIPKNMPSKANEIDSNEGFLHPTSKIFESTPHGNGTQGNNTQGNGTQSPDGGKNPNTRNFQFKFENNFSFNGSSNQNIGISTKYDSDLQNRFFGFHLNNQEYVNISMYARSQFEFTLQEIIHNKNSNLFVQNQYPLKTTNSFFPQHLEIFSPISASDDGPKEYEADFSYNTFYQIDFTGSFDTIDIYSLMDSDLGITPLSNQEISWAYFDNSTDKWELLPTTIIDANITTSIDDQTIENSQIILTLVYISSYTIPEFFWTSTLGILLIGIAIIILVFGSIMSNQEYRAYLLNRFLPINKGPHRLSMEDVLENENRTFIISTILDHPGIHFNQLLRESQISAGTLAWHLDILETFKVIRKERVGQYLLYFSYLDVNPVSKLDSKLQKSRTTLEIMQLIKDNPGIYQNQIAKRMDLNHKTVKYHLDKLRDADIIISKKLGRRNLFYPIDLEDFPSTDLERLKKK